MFPFPSLEHVSLVNIYALTDGAMRAVASNCKNLRVLDIRGCWRITDKGLALVAEYCRKLEAVNVTDCRDVTEKSLTRLRLRGVRLDRLPNPFFVTKEINAMKLAHEIDRDFVFGDPLVLRYQKYLPPSLRLQV